MTRLSIPTATAVIVAAALAGCGSGSQRQTPVPTATSAPTASVPKPHPQAIEPAAGVQAAAANADPAVVGDVHAHAPPLSEVRRELTKLNLCGGVTDPAHAAPVIRSAAAGFVADPGTSQTEGQLPQITAALNALGRALGVTIYGISGYRTPAHSVAVGGYANDPHTKGEAEDIGVNSLLRSGAAQRGRAHAVWALPAVRPVWRCRQHRGQPRAADPERWSAVARPSRQRLGSRPHLPLNRGDVARRFGSQLDFCV